MADEAGGGRCEVVCFTSDTHGSFATLSPTRARTVLEAWIDRTEEIGATEGVEQVFVFENRGAEIGVTLPHPHGQIYGYPYVTPKTQTMLRRGPRAPGGHGPQPVPRRAGRRTPRGGPRRVRDRALHRLRPAAARWPVEVHLAPHRDVPDLPALTEAERADLVGAYLDLLGRLDRYYPDEHPLPYIAGWFQAPVREGRDEFRLHLQVFSVLRGPGKVKFLAGSESAMAAWINDTTPEKVAARLREVSR